MEMPKDPVMLLSYVNTQLRDSYESLDDLCSSLMVAREELEGKLAAIGYRYDSETNRFL